MTEAVQREPLWRRWVVRPVMNQLTHGTEPARIAKAIAFGVTLGLFPLLGTPTLLSIAVGIALRLNQPVLQVFRELTYPLHLATVLLFIRAGENLYGAQHTALSIPQLMERFAASPSRFMADFGMLGVYAVSAWALLAPVLLALIYLIALPLIKRLSNRFTRSTDAA